jgi:hypothetical protein
VGGVNQEPLIVAAVRDHYRSHGAYVGCGWCELWGAYSSHDVQALDPIIERAERTEPLRAVAEEMRDWGEANWTAKGLH